MTNAQADMLGICWSDTDITEDFLNDFELIIENEKTQSRYNLIKGAYLFPIIITLGKIFAKQASNTEPNSLKRISKIFPSAKREIDSIFNDHKETITKIQNNRNNIFAHTGKFIDMLFSKQHVEKLTARYPADYSRLLAKTKGNERYTPDDLLEDIPEIRSMLSKVKKILDKLITN